MDFTGCSNVFKSIASSFALHFKYAQKLICNFYSSWRPVLYDTANDALGETRFLRFNVTVKIVILVPRFSFHDLALPLKMKKMELNS